MAAPPPPRSTPYYNFNTDTSPDQLSEDLKSLQMDRAPRQPPPGYFRSSAPPSMGMPASRPGPPPASRPSPPPAARPGPPPGAFARGPISIPHSGPPQALGRPSMPPSNQPFMPPGTRQMVPPQVSPFVTGRHSPSYVSAPPSHGLTPPVPSPSDSVLPGRLISQNGPSMFTSRAMPGPPPFSTSTSAQQQQSGQPPIMATWPPPQAPVRPYPGTVMTSISAGPPVQPSSPFSPTSTPFSALHQNAPAQPVSPYGGTSDWQIESSHRAVRPIVPGFSQPTRAVRFPLQAQNQFYGHHEGQGISNVDPEQVPHPFPFSSVTSFETRCGNQANIPPPSSCDYIVKDTGNCSPRFIRCTMSQIPCTADILSTSGMQLGLLVQPLALPHPDEEPIHLVDFGESGPVRCSRCKGYINPFMKFIDQGRRFICNLCGFADETPRDYHCNLGPDGRRRDADERPELCRGTVEFAASKEFMVRDPMPAVFFFLIDVSMNAVQTGATAAACSAISQVICELPEGPRTFVGIATFDSTIHFYNLKRALQQPLMLIVADVHDVFTPLQTDVIVPLSECRQHLELLLESIPNIFKDNRIVESAFGAAIKAAFLAMKSTGGKLLVFQSVLPSVGFGALSAREAEGKINFSGAEKVHKLLQPADKTLKTMAIELAEYQVCVDIFITTQTYVDIASISVIPRTTGGQVYYYHPFSALTDNAKLCNDLRWNITRPQGMEAVMRVRCSQGLQVQEYYGNFCKRLPTDVDLPGIDCDKALLVILKHEDKLPEGSECSFQCALLYTTIYGKRRIRVSTLSLPCTSLIGNLFRAADVDAQFGILLKQAANEIPLSPATDVREQVTKQIVDIFYGYRKFCALISSSGQLVMPEGLKLLPLFALSLIKSIGLRTDCRLEDRSFWVTYVSSLGTPLMIPLVYPRMFSIHDLKEEEVEGSIIPPPLPLTSEHISDEGIYFLENGIDAFIYVCNSVDPNVLMQLFGVSSKEEIPAQFVLEQFENPLSKALNDVVNEIRRERCSYLRLKLCKKGDPSGFLFLSFMVEDKIPIGVSYMEFLVHVHRNIQAKMP